MTKGLTEELEDYCDRNEPEDSPTSCENTSLRNKYCPDGLPCSRADLDRRLEKHRQMVEQKASRIIYGKGVAPNRYGHFLTKKSYGYSLKSEGIRK